MAAALDISDALTRLELPTQFDVTTFPRDVEQYLEHTENPFHRAILKNYFRHLLLEVFGYWDQILVPELPEPSMNPSTESVTWATRSCSLVTTRWTTSTAPPTRPRRP